MDHTLDVATDNALSPEAVMHKGFGTCVYETSTLRAEASRGPGSGGAGAHACDGFDSVAAGVPPGSTTVRWLDPARPPGVSTPSALGASGLNHRWSSGCHSLGQEPVPLTRSGSVRTVPLGARSEI